MHTAPALLSLQLTVIRKTIMSKVTLGLIQTAVGADPKANLDLALAKTVEAAKAGAQIVCLQELFRSHYFCQVEDHKYFALAEAIPGPSTEAFCKVAKEHGIVIDRKSVV